MAESVVTTTVQHSAMVGKGLLLIGTIAIGASPGTYTAGGIAFNFGTAHVSRIPLFVSIEGDAGFIYQYVNGTTGVNGKLKILSSTTETTAGAMPAGISGDTITFLAFFKGQM